MLASTSMRCRPSSVSSSASTASARAPAPVPRLCARRTASPMTGARAPAPALRHRARPVGVAAAATKKDDDGYTAAPSPETKKRFDAMLAQLRSTGLNQEKARRLLEGVGQSRRPRARGPQAAPRARALTPARALGTQAAIDVVCRAPWAFSRARASGSAEDFPFQDLAADRVLLWRDVVRDLAASPGAPRSRRSCWPRGGTRRSADALLAAVQTLAGPEASPRRRGRSRRRGRRARGRQRGAGASTRPRWWRRSTRSRSSCGRWTAARSGAVGGEKALLPRPAVTLINLAAF